VNDAVIAALGNIFQSRSSDEKKISLLRKIRDSRNHSERAVENAAKHFPENPDECERLGKLLFTRLDEVQKGMSEIIIPDILGDGQPVRIGLDPLLTPSRNAERYFDKAKKNRRDRHESLRRMEELRGKAARLEALETIVESCGSNEEITQCTKENFEEFMALGLIEEEPGKERPPFRIFTVTGGFEVWVGKNSSNNDLLTMQYAKPNDIWMHARGASGSHTVLRVPSKGSDPPKEAIKQAAGIAAYYSKMRNAKHVPVAYCERKYVRKVKRTPEGTVFLEREEIIFVTPRLP
jgi:predicted ribosome quality control (RQC) complex YloA/Tae2 family protein